MPDVLDPFTKVYNHLWQMAEEHKPLADLVRSGNRIKFVKEEIDHDPRKFSTTPGATPELMLVPDYFDTQLNFDNRQATLNRTWNWVIRVSDRILNKNLFPVEFHLFRAMQLGRSSLLALTYQYADEDAWKLVQRVNIDRGSASIPDVDKEKQNPMTRSWLSVWSITTLMNFPKD